MEAINFNLVLRGNEQGDNEDSLGFCECVSLKNKPGETDGNSHHWDILDPWRLFSLKSKLIQTYGHTGLLWTLLLSFIEKAQRYRTGTEWPLSRCLGMLPVTLGTLTEDRDLPKIVRPGLCIILSQNSFFHYFNYSEELLSFFSTLIDTC